MHIVLAAAHMPTHLPADWLGWLVVIIGLIIALRVVLKVLGLGK